MSALDYISVIVTTYDRPAALNAVLRGLSRQTDRGFEIIVADDGSGLETRHLIERWRETVGVRLTHVWHEHRGFRAPEMRNRAIKQSTGNYCIFLDGDCIPRPAFVDAHRQLAEPATYVMGSRVLMSRALTEEVLTGKLEPELWTLSAYFRRAFRGEINRASPLLTLRLGPLRNMRLWGNHARSCNLAAWREDLHRVDGFDASYVGWGREDDDLGIRLMRTNVRPKTGRYATGVLHLWHAPADRSHLADNDRRLTTTRHSDRIRAARGISQTSYNAEKSRPGRKAEGGV